MKILLAKTIFCPTHKYFTDTITSIIKTDMFIKLTQIDVEFDLYLIGWGYKFINMINSFIRTISHSFKNIHTNFWIINYGKYKIFNDLIEFTNNNHKYDYIIYMDHDVFFDFSSIFKFSSFLQSGLQIFKTHNIGIIAFNQKLDCRHQMFSCENSISANEFVYVWSKTDGAIATGAFIVQTDVFKSISKFEMIAAYGLDDYHLCNKLTHMTYLNVILTNVFVCHPFDGNDEYAKWKKNNIIKLINGHTLDYYQNIEESMNILTQ